MKKFLKYLRPSVISDSMYSMIGLRQDRRPTTIGSLMRLYADMGIKKLYWVTQLSTYSILTSLTLIVATPLYLFYLLASLATLSSGMFLGLVSRVTFFSTEKIRDLT